MQEYDLIVIGAGSGGVRLARQSASLGAKVAVIEAKYLGGACVNVGCVPKKLFVYAAQAGDHMKQAVDYGWSGPCHDVEFNWKTLLASKNREISRLNDVYASLLKEAGVDIIKGHGVITSPNEVTVSGEAYAAKQIAISSGSWPFIPTVPGKEHIQTSNEMFHLNELPRDIVIWGGGYIGLEFAGILNGLGVKTTVVFREDLVMRGFDNSVRRFLGEELKAKGVNLVPNSNIESVERVGDRYQVSLTGGKKLDTGLVMAATGRKPAVSGMGLDQLGVSLSEGGWIDVNEDFQTSVPSIYAIGDVIGTPQLTPVALAQAMALSENLFAQASKKVDYDLIPTAVFSQPNIGTIGMTEEEAVDRNISFDVYESTFKPMKFAIPSVKERFYAKMIVETETDRILGIHLVGDDAGEIIQGFAVAVKMGAKKSDFDATVGIHPTSAEELVTMRKPSYCHVA